MNVKNILAILLGLAIGFGTIFLVEALSHQIYPPSKEIFQANKKLSQTSPKNREAYLAAQEEMKAAMRGYLGSAPLGSMLLIL